MVNNEIHWPTIASLLRVKYRKIGYVSPDIKDDAVKYNVSIDFLLNLLMKNSELTKDVNVPVLDFAWVEKYPGNSDPVTFRLSNDISNPEKMKRTYGSRHDGFTGHWAFVRWMRMFNRCYKENDQAYHNYGARGIKVCDAWHRWNLEGRKNYYLWIEEQIEKKGITPKDKFEVDRIDNDGSYSPENCRIVTRMENCQNTRFSKLSFSEVVNLRKELKTIEPAKRARYITDMARNGPITALAYKKAINGENWTNVNDTIAPVDVPPVEQRRISSASDEDIISWRKRVRALPRKDRPAMIHQIAEETGLGVNWIIPHLTGIRGKQVDHIEPPVRTRKALTTDIVNTLEKEYMAVRDQMTLFSFANMKSKTMDVGPNGIYNKLIAQIPDKYWRIQKQKVA